MKPQPLLASFFLWLQPILWLLGIANDLFSAFADSRARLSLTQNLTNHILDCASLTPLLFLEKPLIQVAADALVKDRQATTPTTLLSQKNKRNSETML
jgi:hypothetical protein